MQGGSIQAELTAILLCSSLAYVVVKIVTPRIIELHLKWGLSRPDAHKPGNPLIAHSGGVPLFIGFIAALLIFTLLCSLDYSSLIKIIAVASSAAIIFAIGFIDDKKILSGPTKTISSIFAIVPIAVLAYFEPVAIQWGRPIIPIIGRMRMTIIYWFLLPFSIAGAANAVNMLDVLNGIVPGTSIVIFAVLSIISLLRSDMLLFTITAFALATLLAYYPFNAYPARIFNGDSGSLFIGGLLGAVAVVFHLEFITLVLLLPHILNGLFVLISFRGFKEHREVKARPILVENGSLRSNPDPRAPLTLTRLILHLTGPATEKEVTHVYIALECIAAVLAFISYLLTPWG
jgi:UDP-N-acetylglucosamine--dolichyl-phosphate N-acetylglucosaminephosphotransferase